MYHGSTEYLLQSPPLSDITANITRCAAVSCSIDIKKKCAFKILTAPNGTLLWQISGSVHLSNAVVYVNIPTGGTMVTYSVTSCASSGFVKLLSVNMHNGACSNITQAGA